MSSYSIEALANYHCTIGENPLWDDRSGLVYWEDISKGRLFRYDPRTGQHEKIFEGPEQIGGFTFQEDGTLLLFRENDLAVFDPESREVTPLINYRDDGMTRFNDVMADPAGRIFAGTIGASNQSGGLYKVETDGTITKLFSGTGCSNGMAFSPDLTRMWWTCSTRKKIFVFDYDRASGTLSNESVFLDLSSEEGVPDGMSVDSNGHIWSARWDGYGIFHYDETGRLIEKVEFEVAKVSSVIFGGPDLKTLYVTTAGGKDESQTADGTLYRVKVPVRGQPEFRSRIRI